MEWGFGTWVLICVGCHRLARCHSRRLGEFDEGVSLNGGS